MFESITIVSIVLLTALLLAAVLWFFMRRNRKSLPSDTMMTIDRKHSFLTTGKSKSGQQTMVVLDEKELFDQPPGF